ncbi:MAG: hypothetical protein WC843_04290 [Candidatus Gracilibacteria bacterium]
MPQTPSNIFLFCGEDTYSAYQKSKHWRDQFEKKYGDININILDGGDLTAAQLNEVLNSVPFLSEKKLTIVNNFLDEGEDENKKAVAEKLANIPDHNILVFIEEKKPDARMTLYKKLKKVAQVENFNFLVGARLTQWIQKEVAQKSAKFGQSHGHAQDGQAQAQGSANQNQPSLVQTQARPQVTIGLKEAQLLAEIVGPNLWQMKQEVEKLVLYCGSDNSAPTPSANSATSANLAPAPPANASFTVAATPAHSASFASATAPAAITAEAIQKLANPNLSVSIFKFTDYIGQKKAKESLRTFYTLLEGGEPIMKIFAMIIRQFRILIQIDDCLKRKMNKNAIAAKMKENPYVIEASMGQCRNFTTQKLDAIYRLLLKIDTDFKSGKIKMTAGDISEFRLTLEKFIVELCR